MEEQLRETKEEQDTASEINIIRSVRTEDGFSVIEVQKEVDLSTSPQLKSALTAAAQKTDHVIVDLSAVSYMDSSGFGILLGATKNLRPEGGSLHLVGCNATVMRMLVITRLNTLFDIHASEDEARAAIRALGTGVA